MPRFGDLQNEFDLRGGRNEPGVGVRNDRIVDSASIGDFFGEPGGWGRRALSPFYGAAAGLYEGAKGFLQEHPEVNSWVSPALRNMGGHAAAFAVDDTSSPADPRNSEAARRGFEGGDLYPPAGLTNPSDGSRVTTSESNFHVPTFLLNPPEVRPIPNAPSVAPVPGSPSSGDTFDDAFNDFFNGRGGNGSGSAFPTGTEGDDFGTANPDLQGPTAANNYNGEPTEAQPNSENIYNEPTDNTGLAGSDLTPEERRIADSNNFDWRSLFGGGGGGGYNGGGYWY